MNFKQLIISAFTFFTLVNQSVAQKILTKDDINTRQLKPTILYWDFGSPEYLTIETIYHTKDSINSYWNVTHRSAFVDDTTGNGFDYYRIEEKALKPVLSHMFHSGFTNYLIKYKDNKAQITIKSEKDTTEYEIPIPEIIAPEGPGATVFLGSLKLKKDYHIKYYELNRWNGKSPKKAQLELTELQVVGVDEIQIEDKKYETYRINITSENGRFTEVWALKQSPHYWVKANHKIDDKRTMKSQVVKILLF